MALELQDAVTHAEEARRGNLDAIGTLLRDLSERVAALESAVTVLESAVEGLQNGG